MRSEHTRTHTLLGRQLSLQAKLLILVLATVLVLASSLFIPLVLAVLLTFLLRPIQRRLPLPAPASALVLTLVTVVATTLAAAALFEPAMSWLDRLPVALEHLEQMGSGFERSVARVTEATASMERLTEVDNGVAIPVRIQETDLDERLFTETGSTVVMLVTMVLLLFFLLAYGEFMVLNSARALSWRRRIRFLAILRHLERDYSTYLFTITMINLGLGLSQGLAMLALGMPDPWLWGALGFLFNYIPFLGAMVGTALVALAAVSTVPDSAVLWLAPLSFYVLSAFEGYFITPMLLGRRFRLNPLALLLGLLVWGWIWGIAGALLAVPILVALKVVSRRVGGLRVVSHAMDGPGRDQAGRAINTPQGLRRFGKRLMVADRGAPRRRVLAEGADA